MKVLFIFALIIHSHYANTNLKNPQCRCYTTSKVCLDDPSVLGLFIMKPYENLSLEDMEGEIWKDVPGYEGKYQASTMGRLRSVNQIYTQRNGVRIPIKGRILSQCPNPGGYLGTQFGGKNRIITARIIMLTFKGPSALHVDHINMDIKDNRLENLEYVTPRENTRRAFTNLQRGKMPCGVFKIKNKYVVRTLYKGKRIHLGTFDNIEEANSQYLKAINDLANIENYRSRRKDSPYGKGIYKVKNLFVAKIWKGKKVTQLGSYRTLEEAKNRLETYRIEPVN